MAGQGHRAGQEEGPWVGFVSWHPCLPRAPGFWWLFPPRPQRPWLSGQLAWIWEPPSKLSFSCLSAGPIPLSPTDPGENPAPLTNCLT